MAIYPITTVVPLIGDIPGGETYLITYGEAAKSLAVAGYALYNNVFICLY